MFIAVCLLIVLYWLVDALLQVHIWSTPEENPNLFHKYRAIHTIIGIVIQMIFAFYIYNVKGIWIILSSHIIGISLYEFLYCQVKYGDWKYYKEWGYKVFKLTIKYPRWYVFVLLIIASVVGLFLL